MKFSKKTIIYTAIIALVLTIVYFSSGVSLSSNNETSATPIALKPMVEAAENNMAEAKTDTSANLPTSAHTENREANSTTAPAPQEIPAQEIPAASAEANTQAEETSANPISTAENSTSPETTSEKISTETPSEKEPCSTASTIQEMPMPVEPENVTISDKEMTCFLTISCHTLLQNMDNMNPEKKELLPADGVIFNRMEVVFYEGESVFNILQREMKKNRIHMEFVSTPIYNSAYIEGINNLYEFDCGSLSGWMYKVNDRFPNYGCSRYQLSQGDEIEWVFTCDLGRDVGDLYFSAGGQRQ